MEKRGIFSVLSMVLLLTLIPSAVSIFEELVFSDTVEDQDVVEIAGKTFKFRIDSQSNKVVVDIDTSGVIIESEECKLWGYFCQISDSTTSYGSYSGAVPNEKITWGKLAIDTPKFVIESDATIVAPLIFAYILSEK